MRGCWKGFRFCADCAATWYSRCVAAPIMNVLIWPDTAETNPHERDTAKPGRGRSVFDAAGSCASLARRGATAARARGAAYRSCRLVAALGPLGHGGSARGRARYPRVERLRFGPLGDAPDNAGTRGIADLADQLESG